MVPQPILAVPLTIVQFNDNEEDRFVGLKPWILVNSV